MEQRVASALAQAQGLSSASLNRERRGVYSDLGLLELDVESLREKGDITEVKASEYLQKLSQAGESASLGFLKNKPKGIVAKGFYFLDEVFRIAAVWCYLIDCALFLVPVTMTLHKLFPRLQIPNWARKFVGNGCIKLSNVNCKVEGVVDDTFAATVSLVAFTHSSTMDAFMIAGTIPVNLFSLAKSELFAIPFFGWLLSSYGGIAVNRGDRNQAINALKTSAERASRNATTSSGSAVAISPEGTRSKSGQLAAFKKGIFYIWEELQKPVVPMVIFGAYDLYPPGKSMSLPGNVVVRFLPPIKPEEVKATEPAARRAEMNQLMRRKVLLTLKEAPAMVGDESPPQTVSEKARHLGLVATVFGSNYALYSLGRSIIAQKGWPLMTVAIAASLATVAISGVVYTYNLMLCKFVGSVPVTSGDSSSSSGVASSDTNAGASASPAGKQKVI
jgi:1-acyl-sn-glycerol-3-phosphate acyltransferase